MAQESWKMDQDETDCHRPEVSVLCINNCGLLGNPATMNLCSKCYQDVRLPKPDDTFSSSSSSSSSSLGGAQTSTNGAGVAVPDFSAERSAKSLLIKPTEEREKDKEREKGKEEERGEEKKASVEEAAAVIAVSGGRKREGKRSRESGMMEQTPPPNRCFSCRKRVGLAGFQCRCGDMFCSSHRYSDKHACSFDYKSAARDAIAKANPIVKAEKIRKI